MHGAIVWPEGVAIVKTGMENGKPRAYKYEEPYEEKKSNISLLWNCHNRDCADITPGPGSLRNMIFL